MSLPSLITLLNSTFLTIVLKAAVFQQAQLTMPADFDTVVGQAFGLSTPPMMKQKP